MKNRFVTVFMLLVFLVSLTGNAQAITLDTQALVYVNLGSSAALSRFASTGLPMYAMLERGLLTGADDIEQQALQEAGLSFQVLDPDLHSGTYYLAGTYPSRQAPDYDLFGLVLLNTPSGVLLRMHPSQADALSQAGAELKRISLTPKPLPEDKIVDSFPEVIDPDPLINLMINQVETNTVYTYTGNLSGEWPVLIGGSPYTINTRHTYSGTPIQKATQYVGEHLANLGLDVEYHQWSGSTYPNVIGELPGLINPDDIFIIGAHLDDMPSSPPAPGADDNASGSVATLIAADIVTQFQWGCTLRFAFWTGEEQGLLGSHAYAYQADQQGENILGYLNLDMIAWNSDGTSPTIELHANSSIPPTLELAQLFADVVDVYNLNLIPEIVPNGTGASDHASFWDYGYTAILGIEDFSDFNPYYHTSQDDMDNFEDWPYYTDFVKASIGTFAHMSNCLIPGSEGALNGHVTAAGSGAPLEAAAVTADDGQGNTFTDLTDPTGYYTMTLPAGTYTVTASLDGYSTLSQPATIIADQTTTLDFVLQPACEPVSNLDFSWTPMEAFSGDVITFTASASGTQPIEFLWDFGDTYTATGATVAHTYAAPSIYTVTLSGTNACGEMQVGKDITILERIWQFFLPVLNR